jgi:serine/threonine protein kinase
MGTTPHRLGDFEIVREIGRGGMGVVYEARQVSLNRKVALKVLAAGPGFLPNSVQRFRREAEAAAKLHHTNIVPVYLTGEQDGTPFYAMELVEGPSLDQVLRNLRQNSGGVPRPTQPAASDPSTPTGPYFEGSAEPSSASAVTSSALSSDSQYFDTVARLIAEVADALDYAHKQGVIHRDMKPSNLLLTPGADPRATASGADGGLRGGRLSVNDFGLARLLEQPGMTLTGEFVGTPSYMSPEQIAAGRTPLDHRTDIYSLGATLYELLTLQRPFTGERRDEVLAQILYKDPKPPRKLNRKMPLDLETICLKALEKDPDRRYQTAGALAEDLRRYVNRFAIAARRAGPLTRLHKWVRRRPALSAALAGVVLLAGAVAFFAQRYRESERQRLAEAERAEQELLAEKRQTALDKAMAAALGGNVGEAERAIALAERLGVSPGQVRLLRGLVAFYRAEPEKAVQELEQAVELAPEAVAPRALLGCLYGRTGQLKKEQQTWGEVERLTPVTPEDFLFKGYAGAYAGGEADGLPIMDEAIRRHDSVIARTMRGEVRSQHALETTDVKDVELALADVDTARNLLPDSPQVLSTSVLGYLAAAVTYEAAGKEREREAALQTAARSVRALGRSDALPGALEGLYFFYLYTGQDDAFFELSRRAVERGTTDDIVSWHAWGLYQRGQYTRALDVLGRCKNQDVLTVEVPRAFIQAELPGGHARAVEGCRGLASRSTNEADMWGCECLMLFLGLKEDAAVNGRRYREQARGSLARFTLAQYDYLCGDTSADDLLKAAGPSKWSVCSCHTLIALRKLAEGDRAAAREHFRQAVATRHLTATSYGWSRAFLARMEKDPNWPPWVPAKR